MKNEKKIDFVHVQFALAQVDVIKTRLIKEGIFDFYQNAEYKSAIINYEYLYDLYEEQKEADL
jgi:hypothetical protein